MATVIGIILGCIAGLAAGFYIGFLVRQRQATARIGSAEQRAETLIADAERNAEAKRREMLVDAQDEVLRLRRQAEEELGARRADADRRESRIQQKEEQLDQRDRQLVERESELQREMRGLDQRDTELNDCLLYTSPSPRD